MKKILLTLFLLATVQLAHAQFVVSAQLGGSFSQGSSSFESRYDGPSPITGLDTTIIDTGSFRNNSKGIRNNTCSFRNNSNSFRNNTSCNNTR